MYWSILEFGMLVLSNEDSWFAGCVVRTISVKDVKGGLPVVFKGFLRMGFAPPFDLKNGVTFTARTGETKVRVGSI